MALTLEAEQRLHDVELDKFFEKDKASWTATVQDTKDFIAKKFPGGAKIRPDDVAKAIYPILEVHEAFKDFREEEKLRGKFWIKDFADFIIDRTWPDLK